MKISKWYPRESGRTQTERLKLITGNLVTLLLVHLFTLILCSAILSKPFYSNGIFAWQAVFLFILFTQAVSMRWLLLHRKPENHVKFWYWLLLLISVVYGALWGVAGVLFLSPASEIHMVFIIVILLSLSVASIALTYPVIAVHHVFILLSLTPMVIKLFALGGDVFLALGMLCILFLVLHSVVSIRLSGVLEDALLLRFENDELLEELIASERQALRSSEAKSDLLTEASHDLRQPLHALTLFVSSLLGRLSDEKNRSIVYSMRQSIDSLTQQFNSLLDLSRIEADKVDVSMQGFAVNSALVNVVEQFREAANEKLIPFHYVPCKEIVRTDPSLLERMVRNLLMNALNHAGEGKIALGCRRRGEHIVIQVCDSGRGIAEEDQEIIFQDFFQLGDRDGVASDARGMGMGLTIVKRLADLLGHKVMLQSTYGKGSCFSIQLEKAIQSDEVTRTLTLEPEDSEKVLADITVLIVDDDEMVLRATGEMIGSWGCHVLTANSVQAVQQYIETGEIPDVLVTDLYLKRGETGLDVADIIHRLNSDVPVIIISGETKLKRLKPARDAGYPLLVKPIKPAQIRNALQRMVMNK